MGQKYLYALERDSEIIAFAKLWIVQKGNLIIFDAFLGSRKMQMSSCDDSTPGPWRQGTCLVEMSKDGDCEVIDLILNDQIKGLGIADWLLEQAYQWTPCPNPVLRGMLSDERDPRRRNQLWERQIGRSITTEMETSRSFKGSWRPSFDPTRLKFKARLIDSSPKPNGG